MEQQMSLFEEGGMKDDGLKKDPVSGNDIPPGSLAKEVRDDIPAQLSDGEYVVPADVVQYFGVKFFEDLRMEAKRGLAEMDATGRIGGEPVSMTMIAIGEAEKEKKKKALGGPVYANEGVLAEQKLIEGANPSFNPADYAVLGFTPVSPVAQTGQTSQKGITKTVTYYHGETGESRVVTFVDGIVTPPEDQQYTQPPWSTNKPAPTTVQKERDDKKDKSPAGWGTDPDQWDFTGWGAEDWNNEVDSLLNPKGFLNETVGQMGFFKASGVANAYAAIELARAKGIDTSEMEKKVQLAYDDLGVSGKGMVTGLKKLMGEPGEYAQTVSYYNKSYRNLPSGKPTPTKGPIDSDSGEEEILIQETPSRQREKNREKTKTIVESRLEADKFIGKDYLKPDAIDKKVKQRDEQKEKIDEGLGKGVKRAKGGLLSKPKRNPKKPRGKGLGSN